jgi:16S rRNA (cytidine1402-2'-O)-methyltransferase
MPNKGKLYLIPSSLNDENLNNTHPAHINIVINNTSNYIVENIKEARRFLKKAGIKLPIDELTFMEIDKHSNNIQDFSAFLLKTGKGENIGLISDAGCPGIADPGSEIVQQAHKLEIEVCPLTGPSSILLSLMASGLNGQNFAFNGYLPIENDSKITAIRELEKKALQHNQSQLFIETPYRNQKMLSTLLTTLQPETRLCIASNITFSSEFIKTKFVKEWRKNIPEINKQPTVFIIGR